MKTSMKSVTAFLIVLPLVQVSASAAVLFADNFNRANSGNIDATLTGITDNTGASLAANAVYSQPWIDPNSASPIYGTPDANAANGGGSGISGNAYQVKTGTGTANSYVNHNFTNASILAAGKFSVTVDLTSVGVATSINQGAMFGIGMTVAEAASMHDTVGNLTNDTHLGAALVSGLPSSANAVADFWVGLRGNNTLAWGSKDTVFSSSTVGANTGTFSGIFTVANFNSGTNVGYEVFYNGISQGSGTFAWSDTNANYIGLDGRGPAPVLDNFSVDTIPEPATAALGLLGLGLTLRRKR
jgi:hypothetical protein